MLDSVQRRAGILNRGIALIYVIAPMWGLGALFLGLGEEAAIGQKEVPLFLIAALHLAFASYLFLSKKNLQKKLDRFYFLPELLFSVALLFFIFAYLFALSANLEYVQRFIEGGGALGLELNTDLERTQVVSRFLPYGLAFLFTYIVQRLGYNRLRQRILGDKTAQYYLPIILVFSLLHTLAFPSFISIDGWGSLAWFSHVPLFMILYQLRNRKRFVFYGLLFSLLHTMLKNYWLGTYSFITLQFLSIIFFFQYLLFFLLLKLLLKLLNRYQFLIMAGAFLLFEYASSSGFLGYPWTLMGHSQYDFPALIQLSQFGGVWLVSFILYLFNACAAWCISEYYSPGKGKSALRISAPLISISAFILIFVLISSLAMPEMYSYQYVTGGNRELEREDGQSIVETYEIPNPNFPAQVTGTQERIAIIQQNTDPRKANYGNSLRILRELSEKTMNYNPDLLAWSETAFAPNIRRWTTDDSSAYLHGIVQNFHRTISNWDTWLLTGNDDYEPQFNEDGKEIDRKRYNAAVLFSDQHERIDTYRKMKLVPFTEYFPFKELLPDVYQLLLEFDVNLWEPGERRVVFDHPKFSFSTPICFEDAFPGEVREFIRGGADFIINVSNDYWSLNPVEGKQHFVAGMFRAVENRRYMLRSTTSGLSGAIDPYGRIIATLPAYEEAWMVMDFPNEEFGDTLYTLWGDWFPTLILIIVLGAMLARLIYFVVSKKGKK